MQLFKELSEKHCPIEIDLMQWCAKYDLLAMSSIRGDLILQRLFWKKAWHITAPGKQVKISTLIWSPDGACLVVAYSNGLVRLCEFQEGKVLYQFHCESDQFVQCGIWNSTTLKDVGQDEHLDPVSNSSDDGIKLPQIDSVLKGDGAFDAFPDRICENTEWNLLVLATNYQIINVFLDGLVLLVSIDLRQLTCLPGPISKVNSLCFNNGLDKLCVMFECDGEKYQSNNLHSYSRCDASSILSYTLIDFKLICDQKEKYRSIAVHYSRMYYCTKYLKESIKQISESWEDILVQLDSKFASYAKQKFMCGGGTVGDDLLYLMIFGSASAELEQFLLHVLGENGLKDLSVSLENTYTNVQRLLASQVQRACHSLFAHTRSLKNMLLVLIEADQLNGLDTSALTSLLTGVSDALNIAGTLTLKTHEFLSVITKNAEKFRKFFRWLHVCIAQLVAIDGATSGSESNPNSNKIDLLKRWEKEEFHFVVDFIKCNFMKEWVETQQQLFNLDVVGQYLSDDVGLTIPYKHCHDDDDINLFFKSDLNCSLGMAINESSNAVVNAVKPLCLLLSNKVKNEINCVVQLCQYLDSQKVEMNEDNFCITYFDTENNEDDNYFLVAYQNNPTTIAINITSAKNGKNIHKIYLNTAPMQRDEVSYSSSCVEFCFYRKNTIAILLQYDILHTPSKSPGVSTRKQKLQQSKLEQDSVRGTKFAMQFVSIDHVVRMIRCENNYSESTIDLADPRYSEEDCFAMIQNARISKMVLSEERKVGCLLLESRNRVRLLDLHPQFDETSVLSL